MQYIIHDYLANIKVGPKQAYKNLVMYPLVSVDLVGFEYLLLDEALERKLIEIVELDKGASVPELKVLNKSNHLILLLDGEELVGAKQNRIINTTILIEAVSSTVIPVSCVEQGRWSYVSDKFDSQKRVMSSHIRAKKAKRVKEFLRATGTYGADQGEIWDDIEDKAVRMSAASPTMAMSEIYEKEKISIEEYRRHFQLCGNQVGAMFFINGKVAGLDSFGKKETFTKVFAKLVDSYALDAIDWYDPKQKYKTLKSAAKKFIESISTSKVEAHPAVALGRDIRFESESITGFALEHEDKVLHLSAFTRVKDGDEEPRHARMQRYSGRRGHVT